LRHTAPTHSRPLPRPTMTRNGYAARGFLGRENLVQQSLGLVLVGVFG
jgi:hypothetical protein